MSSENNVLTLQSLKTVMSALKLQEPDLEAQINNSIEPLEEDLPVIYITGDVPTKKSNVKAELKYESKTDSFTAHINYKLQGKSTLLDPKKNFTIRMFENKDRTIGLYKNFKNWGFNNKFVLKADYNDILHARNVVCGKLWGKMIQTRNNYSTIPAELKKSPNHGAVDGFPVKVYINGTYHGLYCFNVPKDEWMFGMDQNNSNHVVLQAEANDTALYGESDLGTAPSENPCNFNASWDGKDGQYWSYEVGDNALESWNNLYKNIYVTPNINELKKYLDIPSVIDYYIFQYIIYGVDGLARNMMLLTYDKTKWYVSPYDMDNTFGLISGRAIYDGIGDKLGSGYYLNQNSALWSNVINSIQEEVKTRYVELRNSILSFSSIMGEFEKFINIYGEDIYIQDLINYPNIPLVTQNNINYLRAFVKERLEIVDNYILGGSLNG